LAAILGARRPPVWALFGPASCAARFNVATASARCVVRQRGRL